MSFLKERVAKVKGVRVGFSEAKTKAAFGCRAMGLRNKYEGGEAEHKGVD